MRVKSADDRTLPLHSYQTIVLQYSDMTVTRSFRVESQYEQLESAGWHYNWYLISDFQERIDRTPGLRQEIRSAADELLQPLSIAFVTMAQSGAIDDVTAGEHADFFPEWNPNNVSYTAGQIVRHKGKLYKCVTQHNSQETWAPDIPSALWTQIADPTEEWPAWSQPVGAHDAYQSGDKVSHNDKHWTSTADNNVWEPGVYGWEEV